jgi:2-amino-4-hydroxy-6-hydroxymethyldihydropteridine diphosphokinase
MMREVFLGLGSNIGDRIFNLSKAQSLINDQIGTILKKSSIYETKAWGIETQPNFLNMVLQIETEKYPLQLIKDLIEIEHTMGRKREIKWAERNIDIDIIFYENYFFQTLHLTIPHPYMHLRNFVLKPMTEISPDFFHPKLKKQIHQLELESTDNGWIQKLAFT